MIPVNDKILVRVNMAQKDTMLVGDKTLSTALRFEKNYREKSPVIAEVVTGNDYLKEEDIIICHHNHFYPPSPYHLEDDLYSIPFNHTIFARVNKDGSLSAICGNIFGDRMPIKTTLDIPPEYQKTYIDRIVVTDNGGLQYEIGQTVFCRPNAPYDIVFIWDGIEKRTTKINSEMICGLLVN